ncbi:MAG: DEAD/DEAH box helicase [Deltaproteobacteria bacterium]|nr:DEAD/DEAH box helicase [Deltaproteobacteria bacterium]
MNLKEFLGEFGDSLRKKVKMSPVFDPAHPDDWDRQATAKLEKLARQPFPPQTRTILALAKGFYRDDKKAEIMVGEMGVGKTICAIATAFLNPKKNHRTIIMCPGHLVDKWMREIRETIPHAAIVNLNNPGLKELFALHGQKPKGLEFYVVGKEKAKMHFAFKPAIIKRGNKVYCPQCGKRLEKLEGKIENAKRKLKCPECDSPLWQADSDGSRRYAKAEFIKRYIRKGAFDLFVADELHEYKAGDSAQGQALACLAAVAKRTLGLTGTLMGGYSTNLFYLLWRLFPSLMKDNTPYGEQTNFAGNYGVLEIVKKTPLSDNLHSLGGNKNREVVKEKPGVSPLVLSDFLLENAVFMRLQDVSDKLPPYVEEVVGVQMLPDQTEAYEDRGEEVYHPRTSQLVAGAPQIEADFLPKEERLLDLVQNEIGQGRKCIVCLEHTGTRDLIPTLSEKLEQIGVIPLILRANKPKASQRESWIRNMVSQHQVMICNTNLIKTGLDLIEFPTLIFFQTGYSIYTLRQASRRSWRIGQEQPVKVYYLSYLNTMQETALSLIASKMETALAVEGDLTDKGLTALAQSENSMLIELARSLVDRPGFLSLEDAWRSFQEGELQADALLGDEQPVETETTTQTTMTRGDQQSTVKVTRVVRGKVYPQGKIGVGVVGQHRLIFQAGNILFKNRVVGQYDRSGNGQIKGKPIRLERQGNGYLLVELRKAA